MKLPYGYVLLGDEVVVHKEKADVVRSIFEYYLAGASLGKIVIILFPVLILRAAPVFCMAADFVGLHRISRFVAAHKMETGNNAA